MAEENPYSFIVGDESSRGVSRMGGRPKKQKIMMIIALFSGLLIAIMIFLSVILGGDDENKQRLIALAQRQTEIIRVTELGNKKAKTQAAKNLAVNTRLSLITARTELVGLLSKQDVKLDAKTQAGALNSRTDKTLETAEQNNRFDEVFTEQINLALSEYQKATAQALGSSTSKSEQQTLSQIASQAKILANKTE